MTVDMPLTDITEADLQYYVDEKIVETKTLEYKEALPGRDDKAKKKFLADISSFANASGGDIIYGIEEEEGKPKRLCGLGDINVDSRKQDIEHLMRDSIKPRIPRVDIHDIELTMGGVAIVIRIPRSWAGPHAVQHKSESMRFYTRHSGGKKLLDIQEVRAAFLLSETTRERIRSFRAERIGNIMSGEAPVLLPDTGKVVLHILPLTAFDPTVSFDAGILARDPDFLLKPMSAGGWDQAYNFDGSLIYDRPSGWPGVHSYVQVFRSGSIEAVEVYFYDREKIASVKFEMEIITRIKKYMLFQRRLGLAPPFLIMVSLLGVRGRTMYVHPERWDPADARPIDREVLVLPEILVGSFEADAAQFMKPAFDQIWNACGLPRSLNYDAEGNWVGKK